jgi:hypothetical protein
MPDTGKEKELCCCMVEGCGLVFREEFGFRRWAYLEKAVRSRRRCMTRNFLWESIDNFINIRDHVEFNQTLLREVNIHSEIIMGRTASGIKFFVKSIITL